MKLINILFLILIMTAQTYAEQSCPTTRPGISVDLQDTLLAIDLEELHLKRRDLINTLNGKYAENRQLHQNEALELCNQIAETTISLLKRKGVEVIRHTHEGALSFTVRANDQTPLNNLATKMNAQWNTSLHYAPYELWKEDANGMFQDGKKNKIFLNHGFFYDERWADPVFSHEVFHLFSAHKRKILKDDLPRFFDAYTLNIKNIKGAKKLDTDYGDYFTIEEFPANAFSLSELYHKIKEGKNPAYFTFLIHHETQLVQRMAENLKSLMESHLTNVHLEFLDPNNISLVLSYGNKEDAPKLVFNLKKSQLPKNFSLQRYARLLNGDDPIATKKYLKSFPALNQIAQERVAELIKKTEQYKQVASNIEAMSKKMFKIFVYFQRENDPELRAKIATIAFDVKAKGAQRHKELDLAVLDLPPKSVKQDALMKKELDQLLEDYHQEVQKMLWLRMP